MSHRQSRSGGQSQSAVLTRVTGVRRFKLTESAAGDGWREIEIEGELDLAVADRLQQALDRCEGDHVLIDLMGCQFIDSTGLAVILHANRGGDARIVVHSPCDQVLRVLEVTGLAANGLVFADRQQALSALVPVPV